ncbi:MAG: hypothetical protein JOZ27_02140 [Caulobacteraceae bacterium]|nr:hypothetical protein [Caulobacteraceae bacterium]
MALDGTYGGLQASVSDFLNRSDLYASIPDFIALATAQLSRRLRCAEMVASTTLSVSSISTALPSDFNGVVSFELPTGVGGPLRYVKPEEIRALRQTVYASTGTPQLWSIMGATIETAPAPSSPLTCLLAYYQRIPTLSTSNPSNWLLTKHPDAYLYGALVQSAPYLKDDERLNAWGKLYEQAIGDILLSDGRVSFGHGLTPPVRGAALPAGTDAMTAPMPAQPPQ